MTKWVIRHPRRGIYTGMEHNSQVGRVVPCFSFKKDRPGGGVRFNSQQEAREAIDRMRLINVRCKRCTIDEAVDAPKK